MTLIPFRDFALNTKNNNKHIPAIDMKPYISSFLLAAALTGAASAQTPTRSEYGINVGTATNGGLWPLTSGMRPNMRLSNTDGGILLSSPYAATGRNTFDGGVSFIANPVDFILKTEGDTLDPDRGNFNVWRSSNYFNGESTDKPLFQISSPSQIATFEDVDVVINNGTLTITNGTLTIAGSPALTQATSTSYLSGQGFIQTSGLSTALSGITPPVTSSWTNTYVARGAVSNGASVAWGTATASNTYAVANGYSNTAASGGYSWAHGFTAVATGSYSAAFGSVATAEGMGSYAHGLAVTAKSASETVFGRYAKQSTPTNALSWSGNDGLFRVGNGVNSSDISDALTLLKSGETTLSNKEWRKAVALDPTKKFDDPAATDDRGGNALVVEGHTRLKGKVLIEPQGDLSMGSFTGGETP